MVDILFISWFATLFVIAEAQSHPIETQDLKSIVDSIKRDVNRHLKATSVDRYLKSTSHSNPPGSAKSAVEDIDEFMKMIQDSMHHHLIRNLGHSSDAKNGGSPTAEKFIGTPIPEQHSSSESVSEFSSQIQEIRVGSTKGMPGVNFPDYTDIPRTSFTCADKTNFPGFYADLDTGCQVFHVCLSDRRESFLCPMGTIFNQPLRVCDYWYNSNCSLAPYYYTDESESSISNLLQKTDSDSFQKSDSLTKGQQSASSAASLVSRFMPIKAKIILFPETVDRRSKIIASASIGENKNRLKTKSRQKNRNSSKQSTVLGSVHDSERLIEFVMELLNPFTLMNKSYSEVLQFRIAEALDNSLMDIKSNKTLSVLSGHAEKLVRFIKYWFLKQDLPDFLDLEPGSDLHEYDIGLQEKFSDHTVRVGRNALVQYLASILYNFNKTEPDLMKDSTRKLKENALEPAPLAHLNPRFIVKPATEESRLQKDESSNHLKVRIKRSATVLHPLNLKYKGRMNIYPGTKKALLKNYIKLLKTKHA